MGFTIKTDSKYYLTINKKKYAFDLDAIKKFCIESVAQKESEHEITETYEKDEKGDMDITAKILREVKTNGNPQNDMIIYDVVKVFILRLMDNDIIYEKEEQLDFSTSLAVNTLIKCKLLVEVE